MVQYNKMKILHQQLYKVLRSQRKNGGAGGLQELVMGCRDSSAVKSICCSRRRPGFGERGDEVNLRHTEVGVDHSIEGRDMICLLEIVMVLSCAGEETSFFCFCVLFIDGSLV